MRSWGIIRLVLTAMVLASFPQHTMPKPALSIADLARSVIRSADFDLCLPATAAEYEAVGKYGVIRIAAESKIATELPIARAYLDVGGIKIALRQVIGTDPVFDGAEGGRARQVVFYLVPMNIVKRRPNLLIDFRGARIGFSVGQLSIGEGAPAFARLDEYDIPSEPDPAALNALLRREYPDDFNLN